MEDKIDNCFPKLNPSFVCVNSLTLSEQFEILILDIDNIYFGNAITRSTHHVLIDQTFIL